MGTGRVSPPCRHRAIVLEALRRALSGHLREDDLRPWLARETGLDPARQGHDMKRHVYRCLDWFGYLMVQGADDPATEAVRLAAAGVSQHLEGDDPPSATTVCLLMNHHPNIPVPARLRRQYGPVHHVEGELPS